jgi:hypothetical protein
MENSNKPAFPIEDSENATAYGLTKREYFAAMALQGYLSCWAGMNTSPSHKSAAESAVLYADALLYELSKTVTP